MKRLKNELNALVNRGVDRHLRLAVTGLSRSGKTAFITAMVNQLLNIHAGARLPLLSAVREERLLGVKRIPQRDFGIPRFTYDEGLAQLYGDPPAWPTPTRGVSEIRLALRFKSNDSLLRHFKDTSTLYLEIVDYPGEWLLDLPMLAQDYLSWSRQMTGLLNGQRGEWSAKWRMMCEGLDPLAPADENRLADRILCKLGTISSCIPEFWMALVLILIFSVNLKILPSSGAYSTGKAGDVGDRLIHLIMPLTIVVLEHLWYYAYMIRNKILEEVRADYVLLAKAKGLDKKKLMFRHCVRNVMPAYLSIMAIAVPHVLGGTYVVESVFSYPGIGALSYESARYHDYNLLMLLCMMSGILVIFCNIVSQTINEQIDPRMKDEVITEKSEVVEG